MVFTEKLPPVAVALLDNALDFASSRAHSAVFQVQNPANGETIADVPDFGPDEVQEAIESARAAQPGWASRTARDRAAVLQKWNTLIRNSADALAHILTLEQGKPLAEARAEIASGADYIEWFAEEGKRLYGDVLPSTKLGTRCLVLKQPVGVVAAITPWNYPSGMIMRKISPALAAGCSIVVKPAEDTPLSSLMLALLAHQAGIPEDILHVMTASSPDRVGAILTSSPHVRKLSFTGSTEVGKLLMRRSADTVKNLSLELGGNAPFIVFDDADLDAVVSAAVLTKFRNTGQICTSTNRFYIQSGIMDSFIESFCDAVKRLRVGEGFERGIDVGPLINEASVEKLLLLVRDMTSQGAQVLVGGERIIGGGYFFQPTVILAAGVNSTKASDVEIFGPIAPVFEFTDESEVIHEANNTAFGLAAYLWTNDAMRIWRMTEQLEYGMIGVNSILNSNVSAPFGGVKESGIGREGSRYGLDEYLEIKYISIGG